MQLHAREVDLFTLCRHSVDGLKHRMFFIEYARGRAKEAVPLQSIGGAVQTGKKLRAWPLCYRTP